MPARDDETPLPTLEDMRDTLRFLWLTCLERLDTARQENDGGDLAMEWQGAAVAMRLVDYQNEKGDPHRFLELVADGPDGAFTLTGRFVTDPEMQKAPDGLAWQMTGDHARLCEWMLPWVALHIEQGGGYIDFSD